MPNATDSGFSFVGHAMDKRQPGIEEQQGQGLQGALVRHPGLGIGGGWPYQRQYVVRPVAAGDYGSA
jgi:hypothetical protein